MPVLPQPQRLSLHDGINYVAEKCNCETEKAGKAVHAALGEGELVASAYVLVEDQRAGPPQKLNAEIGQVPTDLWAECPWAEFLRRAVLPFGNPMFKGKPRTPVYSHPTIATADIDAWLDRDDGSRKVSAGEAEKHKRGAGIISKAEERQHLTPQHIMAEIEKYERRISGILSRFRNYQIADTDADIFSQLIIEIADLLTDALGPNLYSTNILKLYNIWVQDITGRPSQQSVTEILSAIRAAHTRIQRNPGILINKPKGLDESWKVQRVFIGHGHSLVWRELQNFLEKRLNILVEEFNRVSTAGIPTAARLQEMLDTATFAFLVMTAEDETPDGKLRARMNVVHEAGLFQGKLGFKKAIVLLEDGCEDFSNIHGLGQIRFPKGKIDASFEEIRQVLEREEIILQ